MRTNNLMLRVALLVCIMLLLLGSALAAETDDFTFSLNGDGTAYAVTGYTGSASSVTVPDWYEGLPVTAIGDGAFQGNTAITSVSLPSSITRIGASAFKGCTSLKTVSSYTAASEPPVVDTRVPGDVNDDGSVNMRDALALLKKLADWDVTINESNSDVNADGTVNMRDALTLLKFLADWDVVLK
ncbi:MAG: leucine-rich repeat protein [Clostridia bacterium]|nr:leucine-rich repeat protein [Clostridia bacterium]